MSYVYITRCWYTVAGRIVMRLLSANNTSICKFIMYLTIYNDEGVLYYEPEYNPFNWSSIMRI